METSLFQSCMHYCCNVRIHRIAISGTYFGQVQPCVVGVTDNLGQMKLGDIKQSIQSKHQRSKKRTLWQAMTKDRVNETSTFNADTLGVT